MMRPFTITPRWQRVLLLLLLAAPARIALGHSFDPALLDVRERDAGIFDVRWKLPASLAADESELVPQFPADCRTLSNPPAALRNLPSAWEVDCGANRLLGATLSIRGIDGSRVDVIARITWRDGATTTGVLRSGANEFFVPVAAGNAQLGTRASTILWSYLRLGTEHILFGFDHLLFVLALILLVDSRRMLIKTISAFTGAHSITLAFAVLGIVHVAPPLVEALIALSIVLLALELTRAATAPPTLTRRRPWLVAFVFGLLHGLGFAGALAQIGLPADQIGLALCAFNVGVECGQLAFVAGLIVSARCARPR